MRKRIFKGFAAVLLSSTLTVSTVFAVFADDKDCYAAFDRMADAFRKLAADILLPGNHRTFHRCSLPVPL